MNNVTRACVGCQDETTNPRFCSRSCSVRYNNTKSPKRKKEGVCAGCGAGCASTRKYCNSCNPGEHRRSQFIQGWLNGEERGGTDYILSKVIRAFLIDQAWHACSKCRWSVPHPDTGEVPLEINHINGDGVDHRPENLEVLCANCHSLTSSYRGRNAGNGRPYSYHRVRR